MLLGLSSLNVYGAVECASSCIVVVVSTMIMMIMSMMMVALAISVLATSVVVNTGCYDVN